MPLQRLEHYPVLSDDIHKTSGSRKVFLRDPNGVPIEINFRN